MLAILFQEGPKSYLNYNSKNICITKYGLNSYYQY